MNRRKTFNLFFSYNIIKLYKKKTENDKFKFRKALPIMICLIFPSVQVLNI